VHGRVPSPRHFTYWREQPLRALLAPAGWSVQHVARDDAPGGEAWLEILATRS
jgi:hypothetical protein